MVYDSAAGTSRGTTTNGDWKSSNELYYGSSEGKAKLKLRACFSFLESTKPIAVTPEDPISAEVSNVSYTTADVDIKIDNPAKEYVSEYGYYIGKSEFSLSKVSLDINSYDPTLDLKLDIETTYKKLTLGQTYCYYAYAYIGGKLYKSELKTFKTEGISYFSVDSCTATDIVSNNATLSATFNNLFLSYADYFGFYLGTDKSNMEEVFATHILSSSKVHVNLDIASCYYKALSPNTLYYYSVYAVVGGEKYLSKVSSFVTGPASIGKYTIKYVASYNGQGAPKSQTKQHGKDIYLSDVIPTKEGNEFIGWALNAKSDEPDYMPGDLYTENCDTILYALWEEQKTDSGYVDSGDVDFNNAGGLKKGDINSDKFIDMSDVVVAQKIIARLTDYSDYGANAKTCADVNSDGYLTMVDVTEMQKYIAKLITDF